MRAGDPRRVLSPRLRSSGVSVRVLLAATRMFARLGRRRAGGSRRRPARPDRRAVPARDLERVRHGSSRRGWSAARYPQAPAARSRRGTQAAPMQAPPRRPAAQSAARADEGALLRSAMVKLAETCPAPRPCCAKFRRTAQLCASYRTFTLLPEARRAEPRPKSRGNRVGRHLRRRRGPLPR